MRTYLETHPWLTFTVDFRPVQPKLWLQLGEAQSKCEHIAGVPLRPDTAKRLFQLYLAKGILATTAIEGNTLSEGDVLKHLEGKLKLPPSREYLAQEMSNIENGCNMILDVIKRGEQPPLSVDGIVKLNEMVLDKLKLNEGVTSGKLRNHEVGVARYKGAPHQDCGVLLEKLCAWLNGDTFLPKPGTEIVYSILKAVIAHLYLAWIHPFGDGNGRTARLIEFQILISSGVPAPAAHLLSNHYNLTRTEYYRQLDYASRSGGDVLPFVEYAVQGFVDGLKDQLELIRTQQWDITWRNYVHEAFRDKTSPSDVRKRHLVLDLSTKNAMVPLEKLSEMSTRLTVAYGKKTQKALIRDLNYLRKENLIVKEKNGYRACKEIILAFLPPKIRSAEK